MSISALQTCKSWLFGDIATIDVHCSNPNTGHSLSDGIRVSLGVFHRSIPVSIKNTLAGVDFVMVHYRGGLFKPAHADVMMLH